MNEELQQEFLNETISSLTDLQKDLPIRETETISEDFLRRLFRQIHSVKGTAQTFSFSNLARLAHEIENLLQALNTNKVSQSGEISLVIEDAITHLLVLCRNDKYSVPTDFFAAINRLIPANTQRSSGDFLDDAVPKSLRSKLSLPESELLKSALESGKIFYLIEVFFDFASFSTDFIKFRRILSEGGEIVAVSPSEKADAAKEIGFQIFYATVLQSFEVNRIIEPFKAKIDFSSHSSKKQSGDLSGLLANLVSDGEKKSRILDKKVLFEVFDETKNVARKNLILINYLLLHLLRNAVDHAIESPEERIARRKSPEGKIKISIWQDKDKLILRVEDDGRGIDIEKVTAQAIKRSVLTANHNLTKDETVNLIFAHGFSTAEIVSDISGRGVGLDAVKDLIKKAGGQIEVRTETNRGTIFEIQLPI